jgi:hypothetical protein
VNANAKKCAQNLVGKEEGENEDEKVDFDRPEGRQRDIQSNRLTDRDMETEKQTYK